MSKVRIDRAALAEAASWVAGAVSKNPPTPSLAGILIHVGTGLVTLTAFDHDTLCQVTIEGDAEADPFDVLVSGRFLVQIVSALKGDVVELEHLDSRLAISSGRSTYRAQTMDAREYPELPKFPTHVGTIDAGALTDTLATVEHAVSKDPNLKALSAFNIHGDAGTLTATTTDRYRLARAKTRWADASATTFEVNVPGTALSSAVRGLVGPVHVGAAEGLFGLSDAGRVIITRVLGTEDKFPRTDAIFAVKPVTHVEFDVAPAIEALKRSLLVADSTQLVVVEFTDGLIRVLGDDAVSDGVEEVDCETGFGEGEMLLKFNAAYMMQALMASPAPRATIGLVAPGKQVLIEPVGMDSAAFIVMPRAV